MADEFTADTDALPDADRDSHAHAGIGRADVSRVRGRVFEGVTLLSTVFGILAVAGLLLYVFNDALRPLSADSGWLLTYTLTVGLPLLLLALYYTRQNPAAGEVALASVGLPLVSLMIGGGIVILFVEVVSPAEWFGVCVALVLSRGAIGRHRALRPEAALERLLVLLVVPTVLLFGIPPVALDVTARTPFTGSVLFDVTLARPALLPGIPALVEGLPVRPADWVLLVLGFAAPAGAVGGWVVANRRDDSRGGLSLLGTTVLLGVAGAIVAPRIGFSVAHWVVLATVTSVPSLVYLESLLRRRRGLRGLLCPALIVVGASIGSLVVTTYGFSGPEPWLDWGFLTSPTSRTPEDAGIYPPLVGSILMLVVIVVSAFPVGVGAAVYLEEYAPNEGLVGRIVDLVEINIGNLAGVPSVVYGLLGLALFVKGIGLESGIVVVGGLTVGLLILPIVIISSQEALRSVPDSMRKASYGMGATKWQTTRNVVLPRALPGILTGTILALGRAIGETAPLLMIGAAASVRQPPDGFFSKFSAMPRQIFSWSSEFDADFRFGVLAAGVVTLLVVLLLMNGTAILIRNKYQREA